MGFGGIGGGFFFQIRQISSKFIQTKRNAKKKTKFLFYSFPKCCLPWPKAMVTINRFMAKETARKVRNLNFFCTENDKIRVIWHIFCLKICWIKKKVVTLLRFFETNNH